MVKICDKSMEDLLAERTPPEVVFDHWYKQAAEAEAKNPNAMTLATLSEAGAVQARTVLLKGYEENRFYFYTNAGSRKARALFYHPQASLLFYWKSIDKQVLVEGDTGELSRERVADYFKTRPRESQISAWASKQSQSLESQSEFQQKITDITDKFENEDVPLPPHWTGFCLTAMRIEFWKEGRARSHQRLAFHRSATSETWTGELLYP